MAQDVTYSSWTLKKPKRGRAERKRRYKYKIFGENVIRWLRLEADAVAKDSKEPQASGVGSMCQDSNFGSGERKYTRENFCVHSGWFHCTTTTGLLSTKAKAHKVSVIHSLCLDSVPMEYGKLYNYSTSSSTTTAGKQNNHHFTAISRIVRIITHGVLSSNTAWQWKHEWPFVSNTQWLQIWKTSLWALSDYT